MVTGTGTIASVNNQEKIVGTGTLFTKEFDTGDWISVGLESRKVERILNDFELTIYRPFSATITPGTSFGIIANFSEPKNADGEWFEDNDGNILWGTVDDYGKVSYYNGPNGDPVCPTEPVTKPWFSPNSNPTGVASGSWVRDANDVIVWAQQNINGVVDFFDEPNGTPIVPATPLSANVEEFSDLNKILRYADDWVKTFTWLDIGEAEERPNTVVYTSATLSLSVTKTFTYTTTVNSKGKTVYTPNTITLS